MTTPAWQSLLQQGIHAVQQRQSKQALELLQQALTLQPSSRAVHYWLGNAQRLCGQPEAAQQTFRRLLATDPADFDSALALAFLLREQGRLSDFNQVLLAFVAQPAADSASLLKIAGLLRDSNQFSSAIKVMQHLLTRDPGKADFHFKLARMYQATGQHEAALEAFRSALKLDKSIGGAWLGLATLQRFSDEQNPDWLLICSTPEHSPDAETALCMAFARGKGFDDLKSYDQAWKYYLQGNDLRSLSQPWDPSAWKNFVSRQLARPVRLAGKSKVQKNPVFIVGMLRSGTTLLENLLDQHPRIKARGELNFLAHAWKTWEPMTSNHVMLKDQQENNRIATEDLAGQTWRHMQLDGPADDYYIDKNPLNFRYLSMLAEIMPEARILHLRRDGRDSCLSCFMQLFQHPDTGFANQLDTLAEFYQGYLQLMRYFHCNMPQQIMALDYEDLVINTKETLSGALAFLGLADSAESTTDPQRPIRTASTWQARQAVHQHSVGRWQHYYKFAPGFFDRIAQLDVELGSS
jgi:tetratricopeptide (TPR) repeat protein